MVGRILLRQTRSIKMKFVHFGKFSLTILVVLALAEGESTSHPCRRECQDPPEPQTCHYEFKIETYMSMSKACFNCPLNKTDCLRPHCIPLNGVQRTIMTVNRQFPGPSIEVCEGDRIIVAVKNDLNNGEATSIHWHGFHVRYEQYMDGVGMLTQCPILAFSNFTYSLNASNPGTHWWHAHTAMHRSDGIFGVLTVRQQPSKDINSNTYDEDLPEHNFVINDWLDMAVLKKFIAHHHADGSNKPESVLINGKGKRQDYKDPATNKTVFTDRQVFTVMSGKRYRFRVASNAITNCPLKLSIDNHNLTIIASDGANVEPYETEILIIFGGERFDFVVNANQSVANYWFRFKGLADCKLVKELAILRYEGAADKDPDQPEEYVRHGLTVNPWNEKATELNIPIFQLNSTDPNDVTSKKADVTYYIGMDFNKVDNFHFHDPDYYPIAVVSRKNHLYSPQLNGISFQFPSAPLLSQYDDVIAGGVDICTPENLEAGTRNCSKEFCQCSHVINVNLGQVVELVLIDEGVTFDASHPMHLHGHLFRVVSQKKVGKKTSIKEVKAMDMAGNITRKLDKAVLKDTVIVPDGGYTIIRFLADNPGWWLFHCHLEFHVEIGMSLVIHTGQQSDLPPIPVGFPRCGRSSCDSCQPPATEKPCDKTNEGPSVHNSFSTIASLLFSSLLLV